ncbi:hypothetical protein CDD82_6166 [Ophiocordyceps australis]|uniref:Uncharacterized protein n=1 Tax=Ophiocordyceps australis TaxID=1399860 RepID=A0A2C5Y203_9HYPO|nr:hypothetical protein CDD82_6166 [Ophiocordyceps australis]
MSKSQCQDALEQVKQHWVVEKCDEWDSNVLWPMAARNKLSGAYLPLMRADVFSLTEQKGLEAVKYEILSLRYRNLYTRDSDATQALVNLLARHKIDKQTTIQHLENHGLLPNSDIQMSMRETWHLCLDKQYIVAEDAQLAQPCVVEENGRLSYQELEDIQEAPNENPCDATMAESTIQAASPSPRPLCVSQEQDQDTEMICNDKSDPTTTASNSEHGEELLDVNMKNMLRIWRRLDKIEKKHLETSQKQHLESSRLDQGVSELLTRQRRNQKTIESLTSNVEIFHHKTAAQAHDSITMASEVEKLLQSIQNLKEEMQAQANDIQQILSKGSSDC